MQRFLFTLSCSGKLNFAQWLIYSSLRNLPTLLFYIDFDSQLTTFIFKLLKIIRA